MGAKQSEDSATGRGGRRRIIVASILVAVLVAVWFARARIGAYALKSAAANAGIALSFERLEWEGLSTVRLIAPRARSVARDAVADIQAGADSIAVEVAVWKLMRGDLGGLRRIEIAGLRGEVGPFQAADGGSDSGLGLHWPSAVPAVSLTTAAFTIHLDRSRRVELERASVRFDGLAAVVTAERLGWIDHEVETSYPLDVRGSYRGGRFEVERATWDPNFVLEKARVDLTDLRDGRAAFEFRAVAFDGSAQIRGRLDEGVVYASANVQRFDVGAVARAYVPYLDPTAAGVMNLDASIRAPLDDWLATEVQAAVRIRDVRTVRELDELSARIEVSRAGVRVRDGLVLHGDNAVRLWADAPPLTGDLCVWVDGIQAFAEASVGDVATFFRDDLGLVATESVPGTVTPEPVRVEASFVANELQARVRGRELDLSRVLLLFDGPANFDAECELDAHVALSLHDPAAYEVRGEVLALDLTAAGRHADLVRLSAHIAPTGLEVSNLVVIEGTNVVSATHARISAPWFASCGMLQRTLLAGVQADLPDLPDLLGSAPTYDALTRLQAHRLVFDGTLIDGALILDRGEFETQAGAGRIVRGHIPLDVDVGNILLDPALDVELTLRFEDVAGAITALAPDTFGPDEVPRGFVAGSARIRGGPIGPRGRLDLQARELSVRDVLFDDADLVADLDERAIRIERASARGTLGSVSLSGGLEFTDRIVRDGRIDADVYDLVRLAPELLPSGAVSVHGRASGPLNALTGTLEVDAHDLAWRDVQVESLELAANAAEGIVNVTKLAVRGHGVDISLTAELPMSGIDSLEGALDLASFDVRWNDETAALASPVKIVRAAGGWTIPRLILRTSNGALSATLSHADGRQTLELDASGELPAQLFVPLGIQARDGNSVEASLRASWRDDDLVAETSGFLTARDETLQEYTNVNWKVALQGRRADVEYATIERQLGLQTADLSVTASVPLAVLDGQPFPAGPLAVRVDFDTPDLALLPFLPEAWQATGGARANLDFSGDWEALTGGITIDLSGAAAPGLLAVGNVTGNLRATLSDAVNLDAVDLELDDLVRLRAAGSLATVLSPRALLTTNTSALLEAPLDLAVRIDADDLAPITARVPSLRRARGNAHADLRATGTLLAPRFDGTASLANGEIRTTTNLPSIVDVTSQVRLEGDELIVDALAGEMGGAPFRMEGRVSLGGDSPQADLKLSGTSLLLWRERDVSVRADADLTLKGPLDALVMAGNLQLRDGRYTRKIDFLSFGRSGPKAADTRGMRLFALEEPPFSTMRFDVRVESATPFKISNNVARAQLSPSLSLLGTGALPELRGYVIVEPSRVLLPSGALSVRTGRIEFRPDRPDVPELDIQATARLQGYDIDVRISGPFDDPRVDLSSVPPLPREDLALLLISGRLPGNSLSSGVGQRAAVDIAVYIARDVAVAWFEADEDEVESLAERLEVVVGSDTTRSGADAVLVRLRLAGDLQKHGRAIYATGERDIYDFYNFGLRFVFSFQ